MWSSINQMQNDLKTGVVLGLDVGDARIGVARAHTIARLPEPLEVLERTKVDAIARLMALAQQEDVVLFVVGLPRLTSGEEGAQAQATREFVQALQQASPLPCVFVDESFTSAEADTFKQSKQWRSQPSNDALAACLILQRYFTEGGLDV